MKRDSNGPTQTQQRPTLPDSDSRKKTREVAYLKKGIANDLLDHHQVALYQRLNHFNHILDLGGKFWTWEKTKLAETKLDPINGSEVK